MSVTPKKIIINFWKTKIKKLVNRLKIPTKNYIKHKSCWHKLQKHKLFKAIRQAEKVSQVGGARQKFW